MSKNRIDKKVGSKKFLPKKNSIGDLVVLGDSTTIFGDLKDNTSEELPASYRSHGSEYEIKAPLIIYNCTALAPATYLRYNKDFTAWLFALH